MHQNMLLSGQEAFGESQAAEECSAFSLPKFVSEGKKERAQLVMTDSHKSLLVL